MHPPAATASTARTTRELVLQFQRENDLADDGEVGPQTWSKLLATVKPGDTGPMVKVLQTTLIVRSLITGHRGQPRRRLRSGDPAARPRLPAGQRHRSDRDRRPRDLDGTARRQEEGERRHPRRPGGGRHRPRRPRLPRGARRAPGGVTRLDELDAAAQPGTGSSSMERSARIGPRLGIVLVRAANVRVVRRPVARGATEVLEAARCEVYVARLSCLGSHHHILLDEREAYRRAQFRSDGDRDRFTLATVLLRALVAQRTCVDFAAATIDRTCDLCGEPHGRPRLPHTGLEASISHASDVVAVALDDGRTSRC